MISRSWILIAIAVLAVSFPSTWGFAPRPALQRAATISPAQPLYAKKPKEDLSYIETRDMTREEMEEVNKKNEDIMNAELAGMTIFSLILSIPMLYLVWVGFFSETAGDFDM